MGETMKISLTLNASVLAFVVTIATFGDVYACDWPSASHSERYDNADVAFVGNVVGIDDVDVQDPAQGKRVRLSPLAVKKGSVAVGQEIGLLIRSDNCTNDFKIGETWLVLGKTEHGELATSRGLGSAMLTSSKGFYQRAWWIHVKEWFAEDLTDYLNANSCTAARLSLYDFYTSLPRGCTADADCVADQYIDTHQCYPPVVTNQNRVPKDMEEKLKGFRGAAITACESVQKDLSDCDPKLLGIRCDSGVCAESLW
jgi:hypothetical protein